MTDTSRDAATLLTSLADNTSGAITAQVLRDFLVSVRSPIDSNDRQPTSPDAWDEEFNSGLGGFSAFNLGATATVVVSKGAALITRTAADTTDNSRGIAKASPSGTWTIEALLTFSANGSSYQVFGIGARRAGGTPPNVANTTTDQLIYYGPGSTGSGALGMVGLRSASSGGSTSSQTINPRAAVSGRVYVRLAWDNVDTLTWSTSNDGIGWSTLTTSSVTTSLGGAPDSVVFAINNEIGFQACGAVHYARRVA